MDKALIEKMTQFEPGRNGCFVLSEFNIPVYQTLADSFPVVFVQMDKAPWFLPVEPVIKKHSPEILSIKTIYTYYSSNIIPVSSSV